jgi:hypothetical protein
MVSPMEKGCCPEENRPPLCFGIGANFLPLGNRSNLVRAEAENGSNQGFPMNEKKKTIPRGIIHSGETPGFSEITGPKTADQIGKVTRPVEAFSRHSELVLFHVSWPRLRLAETHRTFLQSEWFDYVRRD